MLKANWLRSRRGWIWWACVVTLSCAGLLLTAGQASGDRNEPLPSPLYQHSLQTSVDRFEEQAGTTINPIALARNRQQIADRTGTAAGQRPVAAPARYSFDRRSTWQPGEFNTSNVAPARKPGDGPSNVPDPAKIAQQGGDDIASATPIPSLPYSNTGTTSGFADDYNEICPFDPGSYAPDVVYSYTPASDQLIDIDLCPSLYDTKVYVYEGSPSTLVACNDDFCGTDGWRSRLECVPLTGGQTYYIVVDGYSNLDFGDYTIDVSETDPATCGPCSWPGCSGIPEGESCGNQDNDGCNVTPAAYGSISPGMTICGEVYADGGSRDTDFFLFPNNDGDSITFCVTADFPFNAYILDFTLYDPNDPEGCSSPDIGVVAVGAGDEC
ncbi:MAG TPA: hypothetical protein VGB22_10450, partial [candidate division Zixibacteria bacterium]